MMVYIWKHTWPASPSSMKRERSDGPRKAMDGLSCRMKGGGQGIFVGVSPN